MLPERALSGYFRLLTFTGILPISLNSENKIISTKFNRKACFLAYICNNILIIIILIYTSNFNFNIEGETVQGMSFIEENLICCFRAILQNWFFFKKKQTFNIVKIILKNNIKKLIVPDIFSKDLKIFIFCNFVYHLYCFGILVSIIFHSHLIFEYFLTIISHSLNYLIGSLILSFYTCLILNIQNNLSELNKRLDLLIMNNFVEKSSFYEIQEILKIRNNLLTLCQTEICSIFGVPIILITILGFLLLVHEISISIWIFTGKLIYGILISNCYTLIGLVVHLRAFYCNQLRKEVRIIKIYFIRYLEIRKIVFKITD